jgi:hypothetical protein
MIYSGSGFGSYFERVLVPVPVLDPDLLSTVFPQQKIVEETCLFNARSSIVSQEVGL